MSSLASERAAVAATIDPQTLNNTTADSDGIDLGRFGQAMFILAVGGTDASVDCKLQESATSGGSYTDLPGKAISQLSGTDDNKQAILVVRSEELSSGKRFVRARVTAGSGATGATVAVIGLGMQPRYAPATDDDLTSVAEIVA